MVGFLLEPVLGFMVLLTSTAMWTIIMITVMAITDLILSEVLIRLRSVENFMEARCTILMATKAIRTARLQKMLVEEALIHGGLFSLVLERVNYRPDNHYTGEEQFARPQLLFRAICTS
jgi:hypothetical protein